MAFNIRLRDWFFQTTASATSRGSRLKDGDRPSEAIFKDLTDNTIFKSEGDDRAKEDSPSTPIAELNGHVVAATDTQAKEGQAKKGDRTLVTQPSQLPTVESSETLTISSPNTPYAEDTPLEVSIDSETTTRNKFLTNFKSGFSTWLQTLVAFVDSVKSELDSLNVAYGITVSQVNQNTADIAVLSPGGSPAVVPVGAIVQWASALGVPATFYALEGQELEKTAHPLLYAVVQETYATGGETAGYFRMPDMRDKVARGSGSSIGSDLGSDTTLLVKENLPPHVHDGSGLSVTIEDPDEGEFALIKRSITGESATVGNPDTVGSGNEPNILDTPKGATLPVDGNTGFNVSPTTPISNIPNSMLVKFIMKGD